MTLDESRHHPGAIGRVIPTYQARLVDAENGKDVEIGERGELWLKGPSVMKGYWRNEEATRNVFEDGWFKTGDIAIVDDRKYFTYVLLSCLLVRWLINILQYCRQSKGAYQVQRLPSATGRA